MKKISILLTMLILPMMVFSQSAAIDKIIDKYSGQEGVTIVNIGPELFTMLSNMDDNAQDDLPLNKLSSVKIVSIENEEILAGMNFYDEVTADLNLDDFMEVITVKDGDEDVNIRMKMEGEKILEFFLVVSSPDEGVVIHIDGDFSMSDIEGLAHSFGGLDVLNELEDLEID